MGYDSSVFINCPFDNKYRDLIEKMIFILSFYNLDIKMSLTKSSAHDRLENISRMIQESKYTIHDLSRHKSSKKGEFARFNMPFELGIDFGCYKYMADRNDKIIAIFDSFPHEYDIHLSDMSGRDIFYHHEKSELLFELVPDWLSRSTAILYDAPKALKGYFEAWEQDLERILKKRGFDSSMTKTIDINQYYTILKAWIPTWKSSNSYVDPTP